MSSRARVHFVTLGCPKNRVDSELMLGHLQDAAFDITLDADEADVIVVNTCGFIEDAKKESIDTIMEMAQYKEAGRLKRLVVTGCLVQRYAQELKDGIPEIDVLLGNGEYAQVAQAAVDGLPGVDTTPVVAIDQIKFLHDATTPRVNTFLPHSAYVKIAEGCDQKCTFCIIPSLRGLQRSRPIDDVVREAEAMAARGVVELNLIAQDLTGYGHDLDPKVQLADLLRALGKAETPPWIRLHYAYPRPYSKKLLSALAEEPKILPYVDMPLQHIADGVLKRMARGRPRKFIEKLLGEIRAAVPHVVMRSSFIVGFPGETDADFRELCDYVEAEDFEHVGVFRFSREEGTPSYDLPDQIPTELIEERYTELRERLTEKSRLKKAEYVGKRIEVLVDGPSEETELLIASRHKGQAPEVDGTTYINDGMASAGDLVEVEITESFDFDLVGHVTRMVRPAPARPDHPRLEVSTAPARLSRGGRASLRVVP